MTADRHADPAPPQPARPETPCDRTYPHPGHLHMHNRQALRCPGIPQAGHLPCSAAVLRQPHSAHDWQPQPGMAALHCGGFEGTVAATPGPKPAQSRPCTWPNCLTPGQSAELVAQITAEEHGEHRPPMPDQRQACGCTETGSDIGTEFVHQADHPDAEALGRLEAAMTAQQAAPAPVDETLAQRVADAIRGATCNGDCGETEEQCVQHRIQPVVWHFGVLAEVSGTPEQFAAAVLAELAPELEQLREAKTALAKVRALHEQYAFGDDPGWYCAYCNRLSGAWIPWPCDTIRALDAPAPDTDQPPTARADAAEAALAEVLAGVRTYRDADTGQPIHVPGHISPEQYQRWQRIEHGQEATS